MDHQRKPRPQQASSASSSSAGKKDRAAASKQSQGPKPQRQPRTPEPTGGDVSTGARQKPHQKKPHRSTEGGGKSATSSGHKTFAHTTKPGSTTAGQAPVDPSSPPGGSSRPHEPTLPVSVQADLLGKAVLRELSSLPEGMATRVGRHLAAAGLLVDEEPELAYQHAAFAHHLTPRLAVVREAVGIAAYKTGRFAQARSHLQAVRRIGGVVEQLPVLADIERALGRPDKAIELAGDRQVQQLDATGVIEMRIVAAGARRDLGQLEAALVTLQVPALHADDYSVQEETASSGERGSAQRGRHSERTTDAAPLHATTVARLRYAYADVLLAAGREEEALEWFLRAEQADVDEQTDAAEMVEQLAQQIASQQDQ